jgi:hypothetical protein
MISGEDYYRNFIQWRFSSPAIIVGLLLYGYLINRIGKTVTEAVFPIRCARFDLVKEFRQLSVELVTLGLPILAQACFSKTSDMNIRLASASDASVDSTVVRAFVMWIYLVLFVGPLIFIRFSLLDAPDEQFSDSRKRILFKGFATASSWLLGLVALELALNLARGVP